MAKYLQDLFIHGPIPPFHSSADDEKRFYSENLHLWTSIRLIEDLYNDNFPSKYSTPDNLWRLDIHITTDANLDLTKDGFENWFYLDLDHLRLLDETGRKVFLFEKISSKIIEFCKKSNYSFTEFQYTNKIISDKNILFDEQHKKGKSSPDRKRKAFLWRKYSEFENATYIKITDKRGQTILFKKIGDIPFRCFDRISWPDNETILAYIINPYNGGIKQADDYFKILLDGSIEFVPQTREEFCYYGAELLKRPETFEQGLEYIKTAEKMGHGKARNILLNLKINPDERNVDRLMRQPSKKLIQ